MIHFQLPAEYAKKLADALQKELADIADPGKAVIDIKINAYTYGSGKMRPDTINWHYKLMPDGTYSSCYDD